MSSEARSIAGGPALFQGPDADHWARLLVREHLDATGRLALLRTCQHARDLVLANAPNATISLKVRANHTDGPARCEAARRLLRQRVGGAGGAAERTTLLLTADTSTASFVLYMLGADLSTLHTLEMGATDAVTEAVLQLIPCYCPSLRILRLFRTAQGPPLLPGLEQLHIETHLSPWPTILTTIVTPFAQQLRTLHIYEVHLWGPMAGQLRDAAPGLTDLRVHSWIPWLASAPEVIHSLQGSPVPWRVMSVSMLYLSSLAFLPSSDLEIVIHQTRTWPAGVVFDVGPESHTAIVAGAAQARFRFVGSQAWIPGGQVEQQHLLGRGMQLLRQLRGFYGEHCAAPPERLYLQDWVLTSAVLRELHGLPAWTNLRFGQSVVWQGGAVSYATLLRLLPASFNIVGIAYEVAEHGPMLSQLHAICAGSPVRPLTIELVTKSFDVVDDIQMELGGLEFCGELDIQGLDPDDD